MGTVLRLNEGGHAERHKKGVHWGLGGGGIQVGCILGNDEATESGILVFWVPWAWCLVAW